MKLSASVFAIIVMSAALSACSLPGGHSDPNAPATANDGLSDTAAKRNNVHLSLIRDMISRGQYYAALAHIEDEKKSVGPDDVQLRLLEADTRRELGQVDQARTLYESLMRTSMQGQAEHGIGLLYARQGQMDKAISSLRQAVDALPTDVDIRNDLGYALMQAGRYDQAMPQLSTAAELAPNQLRSRNNLIILMYLMGNDAAAMKLAQRSGLDAQSLARLRQDARNIQSQQRSGSDDRSSAG